MLQPVKAEVRSHTLLSSIQQSVLFLLTTVAFCIFFIIRGIPNKYMVHVYVIVLSICAGMHCREKFDHKCAKFYLFLNKKSLAFGTLHFIPCLGLYCLYLPSHLMI